MSATTTSDQLKADLRDDLYELVEDARAGGVLAWFLELLRQVAAAGGAMLPNPGPIVPAPPPS